MKFTSAIAFFALALTGVEATKHGVHGGGLALQELLALRNGVVLPEMVASTSTNDADDEATRACSSAYTRATDTDTLTRDESEEGLEPLAAGKDCAIKSKTGQSCSKIKCIASGGVCKNQSGFCISNLSLISACDGCKCSRN